MVHHHDQRSIPRGVLIGAAALIAISIAAAATGSYGAMDRAAAQDDAVSASRMLRFEDRLDGSIAVIDHRSGALIDQVDPGTGGFVRGVLRGMARDRKRTDGGPEVPFLLALGADGHLTIADSITGRRIDLGAFGATNVAAFARMLAPCEPVSSCKP